MDDIVDVLDGIFLAEKDNFVFLGWGFRQGGFGNGFVGWLFIEHLQEAGNIDGPVLFGEHLKPMVGNDVIQHSQRFINVLLDEQVFLDRNFPKQRQRKVHPDISLDRTSGQVIVLARAVSHRHSEVRLFHFDKGQARDWLPTGADLFPHEAEVAALEFGDLFY